MRMYIILFIYTRHIHMCIYCIRIIYYIDIDVTRSEYI